MSEEDASTSDESGRPFSIWEKLTRVPPPMGHCLPYESGPPDGIVDAYRRVITQRDKDEEMREKLDRMAQAMRLQWKAATGNDTLHETAFGKSDD
jgi:hypothetical protein